MPERLAGLARHRNGLVPEEDNKRWIWIMQVMIRFCDGVEFERLCLDYLGRRAEFVQDFVMATAPGMGDRCVIYQVPTESPLATWIQLARPEWVTTTWNWHQAKSKENNE